jgi:Secretion system C-terminal sorting domain/N-terminal domain of BNR-repeat neuraminidase
MKKVLLLFLCLLAGNIHSQNVGTYVFTNTVTTVTFPSSTTYFTINGGGGSMDNGYSLPITIPFAFNYGGTDFTQYVMCSNGFLAFGSSLTSSEYAAFYNPWTGTRNNVICYMARDMFPDASTFFGYTTEGTAPNRIHKILCFGIRPPGILQRGNCQVYLYEGSNRIEIIYSAFPLTWTGGCLVGLRGGSTGSAHLRTLSGGTGSAAWTNPVAGNLNNVGISQQGVNADEGRMYTFYFDPTPMFYISSTSTQTLTTSVYSGATNQQLIGIEIVTGGYTSILNLTGLTLNTNGSTNASSDVSNAKIFYTGATPVFSSTSLFGSAFNSPNGSYTINGSQALLNGANYFWLAYDISPSGTPGNVVDAEFNQLSLSGSGGTHVPSVQAPAGNRQIIPALTSVNVGSGETYTSLTNAGGLFDAINTGAFPIAANITVNVTSNLNETGTVALNDWQNSYSLKIVPSAGIERLISGSNSNSALLTLNGADRVNIDGRYGGSGKFFRLRNTSGSKPTIQFMNDARRNTVRDCYVESNNTQTASAQGTIHFGTTLGSGGNDSNTIMNCDIRNRSDAAGNPVYGIVCWGNSSGTTQLNSENVITGCNIYNFNAATTYGIYLLYGTGSNWRIENNSFYNNSSISATFWFAVFISSTTEGNQQILNNYIGGSAPNCGGSALSGTLRTLNGIFLRSASTTVNNLISGNTLKNINVTKTSNAALQDGLIGIYATRSTYTITNNVIGDTVTNDNVTITGSSGITLYGSFIRIDSSYTLSISNNTAGSISINTSSGATFSLISYSEGPSTAVSKLITNNKIGSFTVPNSIRINSPSYSNISCIETDAFTSFYSAAQIDITNNMIANISNTLPNSSNDGITGIKSGGSYNNNAVYNVLNNVIYNLTSPVAYGINFSMYDGLQFSGGTFTGYLNVKNNIINGLINTGSSVSNATIGIYLFCKADFNDVSGNRVYNLVNTQSGSFIQGIAVRSNYFFTGRWPYEKNLIYNNQISITNGEAFDQPGKTNGGDSFTNSLYLIGIDIDHGDSARIYNNSVYIGGVNSGTENSECLRFEFYNGSNVNPDVRNNLLINNRTGGGDHNVIVVELPDTNIVAGTFNYNTYSSSDPGKICKWGSVNCSFEQWKTNSQSDKQSWSALTSELNPLSLYINPAGGNLNINYNNPEAWIVSGKGLPLSYVSADIDGNSRSTSVMFGYPTDIGSNEFTQTPPNNPSAVQTGTPGPGSTTTYTLFGREIMQINWGAGGTSYPAGMDVKYFSGVLPPGITGGYSYSYWQAVPTGSLAGTTYDITINYGENETHSITSPSANIRLAKKDSEWTAYNTLGTGNLQSELDWSNRRVKVRGLSAFSQFALIDFSNPLPVDICSFRGISVNRNVLLNWSTCSELNNAGFEIERRTEITKDKQYSQWQKTGFLQGYGTTNEMKHYSFEDRKLSTGKFQYRLKQIDLNGNAEYYRLLNPEIIEIGKPVTFDVSQNYPNPSNPKSKIDFQIPNNGKVNLVIYDMLGREVSRPVNNEIREAGYYTVDFDGTNLASGIYFYMLHSEGFTKTKKMVIVK